MDKIIRSIQELRAELVKLVEKKGTLVDSEVIIASKMLDALLNEYDKLLNEKNKKEQ